MVVVLDMLQGVCTVISGTTLELPLTHHCNARNFFRVYQIGVLRGQIGRKTCSRRSGRGVSLPNWLLLLLLCVIGLAISRERDLLSPVILI